MQGLADELSRGFSPAESPDPTSEHPVLQGLLEAHLASRKEWAGQGGFWGGFTSAAESGKTLPFAGDVLEGYRLAKVWNASRRTEQGQGTPEDTALLRQWSIDQSKERIKNEDFWYRVGAMTGESMGFAAEFLLTGGVGPLLREAGGKMMRKGVEEVAGKAVEEALLKKASKKAGAFLFDTAAQTATMEAVGKAGAALAGMEGGGGPITSSTWERALAQSPVWMKADPQGELLPEIIGHTQEFVDTLDQGIVDALIEVGSEQSGEALVGLGKWLKGSKLAKLAPIDRARALYGGAIETIMRKTGLGPAGAGSLIRRAGFQGTLVEIGEEFVGEAAKKSAPNLQESWSEPFQAADNIGEMLISFSLMGQLGGQLGGQGISQDLTGAVPPASDMTIAEAAQGQAPDNSPNSPNSQQASEIAGVTQTSAPNAEQAPAQGSNLSSEALVQAAASGEEIPTEPSKPVTPPGQTEQVAAQGLAQAQQVFPDLTPAEVPAEWQDAAQEIQDSAAQSGADIRWVKGDEGFKAAQVGEGVFLMNVSLLENRDAALRFRLHEHLHDLGSKKGAERVTALVRDLAQVDPKGLAAAIDSYRADAPFELIKGLALEEGAARRAEELGGLIEYLKTDKGDEWLRGLYRDDRTAFQRLLDWIKELVKKMGLPASTTTDKRLQALSDAMGQKLELPDVQAAEVLRDALGALRPAKGRILPPSERPTVERPSVPRGTSEAVKPQLSAQDQALVDKALGRRAQKPVKATEPAPAVEVNTEGMTPAQARRARQKAGKREARRKRRQAAQREARDQTRRQPSETRAERAARLFDQGEENPARFAIAPREGSEAFKKWFGSSAVVDENAEPMVVYHGTQHSFTEFRDPLGEGMHFGSARQAGRRTGRDIRYSGRILPVYLSIQNPKRVEDSPEWGPVIAQARSEGYDGLVYSNQAEGLGDSWVAFRPEQIKSATGNVGTYDPSNPDIRFAVPRQDQLGFYSAVEKAALDSPQKSYLKGQVRPRLKKYGAKDEELDWMGLDEWLESQPEGEKISAEALQAFIRENAVVVGERVLGSGDPRYSEYQLPGGENYRELLLTLPGNEYKSPHFDTPNILAHVRFNERTDAEGKRVLFIEEVQSDWHQAGREKGYAEPVEQWEAYYVANISGVEVPVGYGKTPQEAIDASGTWATNEAVELKTRKVGEGRTPGVPDAPFKQSWPTLALKRMIRWAAETGFDKIAWTTGAMQADRYRTDLRQKVSSISWTPGVEFEDGPGGFRDVTALTAGGPAEFTINERGLVVDSSISEARNRTIEDVVGKEMARRIMSEESGMVEGEGLTIGGKGFTEFYDKRLVSTANKLGKKFGAKVGRIALDAGDYNVTSSEFNGGSVFQLRSGAALISVHPTAEAAWAEAERLGSVDVPALPITTKMRESVTEYGLPRFAFPKRPQTRTRELKELRDTGKIKEQEGQLFRDPARELVVPESAIPAITENPDYSGLFLDWLGQRDLSVEWAEKEAARVERDLISSVPRRTVGEAAREAISPEPSRRRVREMDQAMHVYIDLGPNAQEQFDKYSTPDPENGLQGFTEQQRRIYNLSQNLPEPVRRIADRIRAENEERGKMLKDADVIRTVHENYTARIWKQDEAGKGKGYGKFTLNTARFKARSLESILHGWALGKELEIKGAIGAQLLARKQTAQVLHDRNLMEVGKKAGLLSAVQQEGWDQVEHPNFTQWVAAGQMELTKLGEGKVWGRNLAMNEDGTVFMRQPMYAPKAMARKLNRALMPSKLRGVPGIDALTRWNAIFKATTLFTNAFHHQAFGRSFSLGTPVGFDLTKLSPVRAYREGGKAIDEWGPDLRLLVEQGLTLRRQRDIDEAALKEKTAIGRVIDKVPMAREIKNALVKMRDQQIDFLFHRLGPHLKASAALLEYRHLLKKNQKALESGAMTESDVARIAASLSNDDFGGLNLARMERDPTVQHVFRLLALAPDWTESNVRTMVKAFQRGAEGAAYRGMWARVAARAGIATVLFNLLMAGMDDDDRDPDGKTFWTRYKRAWDEGHLRWLEADITPLYRAAGGESPKRKYFTILGHFRDPIKFITHPVRSAKHKSSVVSGLVMEAWSGEDWAGRPFTTWKELLGIDDKGVYRTSKRNPDGTWAYRKGEPKGGKLAGETVSWSSEATGSVDVPTIPSFLISEAKGVFPIQAQNLSAWLAGEMDGFDAITKSLGLMTSTTRELPIEDRIKELEKEWEDTQSPDARKLVREELFHLREWQARHRGAK